MHNIERVNSHLTADKTFNTVDTANSLSEHQWRVQHVSKSTYRK